MNAVISTSLRTSMCYLLCTNIKPDADLPDLFEPIPGTHCQPKCWEQWHHSKNLKLFGLEQLEQAGNEWKITADDFVNRSFQHWQSNRLSPGNLFQTLDEAMRGVPGSTSSGTYLPVCYSPSMALQDLGEDLSLPCVCGTVANETASFFQEDNMYSWVGAKDGYGLVYNCQTSFYLSQERPTEMFLALCAMQYHYPLKKDLESKDKLHREHHFREGADTLCPDVEKQVGEIIASGGDSNAVNCHMCSSETGAAITKLQIDHVHCQKSPAVGLNRRWDLWNPCASYNFQEACNVFAKRKLCG